MWDISPNFEAPQAVTKKTTACESAAPDIQCQQAFLSQIGL